MELKSEMVAKGEKIYLGSNRTFMELKLAGDRNTYGRELGSNRTFMELKCISRSRFSEEYSVLIAPLWN